MTRRRTLHYLVAVAFGTALAVGCASTPDSRIKENQTLFDSYPVEVKANIRQGKVEIGYDEDMARMAMGDPDEKSTETDENGETVRWGYVRSRPGISVGVGGGSFGGGGGVGGGVGMGSGPTRDYTAIIEFREGEVTNVRHFDE
jgi:hypothetical protein